MSNMTQQEHDNNIKHLILMHVPDMTSYEELSKSFIIHRTNADGKSVRIMMSKDAVLGGTQGQCFDCKKTVILRMIQGRWVKFDREDNSLHRHDEDDQSHKHSGYTVQCWECGIPFCRRCMGHDGNMSDEYCGC